MPQYRRAKAEGATYFFTVVTHLRRPVLCLPESLDAMKEVITRVAESHPFRIDAWVILPDHLHCVWTMPDGDSDFSVRWALVKKDLTRGLCGRIGLGTTPNSSRQRHREGTLWQRRFWEHRIRDEQDYRAHVEYVHFNPVKHGLAARRRDWRYSSFNRWVARGLHEEDWGSDGKVAFPERFAAE